MLAEIHQAKAEARAQVEKAFRAGVRWCGVHASRPNPIVGAEANNPEACIALAELQSFADFCPEDFEAALWDYVFAEDPELRIWKGMLTYEHPSRAHEAVQ